MEESVQQFRSHMQRVVSLINLHIQYEDSATIPDFVRKLRLRVELMAEAFPLAVGVSEQKSTIGETFEALENIVARVYDAEGRNSCRYAIGDLAINSQTLATLGQIFAEFLSNIYSRPLPANAPHRVEARLAADGGGQIVLTVRDAAFSPAAPTGPVELLTSRVIFELARSLNGYAQFDGANVYDARLAFPEAIPR
jgi:two-component sensor histidine kinase